MIKNPTFHSRRTRAPYQETVLVSMVLLSVVALTSCRTGSGSGDLDLAPYTWPPTASRPYGIPWPQYHNFRFYCGFDPIFRFTATSGQAMDERKPGPPPPPGLRGAEVLRPDLQFELRSPVGGSARVDMLHGAAYYAQAPQKDLWIKLQPGRVLGPGTNIFVSAHSQMDLFLKMNGPLVRLMPNTLLTVERLVFEDSAQEAIETVLALRQGRILGLVKKLPSGSQHLILVPKGYVAVTGAEYDIDASGKVSLYQGEAVVTYQQADGRRATFTLRRGEFFSPPDQVGRMETVIPGH